MGYTTDFEGSFKLDKPLIEAHAAYLRRFAETRRMKRDPALTETRSDPVREAVGLPVGKEGGYFVAETGFAGQDHGEDVVDHNRAPAGQPGLWCQWVPNEDGTAIEWDMGEKFYEYTDWLVYLIEHFLEPWGYVLNGEVMWQGEESSDRGRLYVKDNKVAAKEATITYPEPDWD